MLSRAKLERAGEFLRDEIAAGKVSGAVLLIQRHGHAVYFESFGLRDPETKQVVFDVEADHIGGSVDWTDASGNPSLTLEPLRRPITIEDLLRHISGVTYGFYGDGPVRKLYANSDILGWRFRQCAIRRASGQTAACRTAGNTLGLPPLDRRARPRRRGGFGVDAVSVREAAAARSACGDRDGVLCGRPTQRPRIAEPMFGDRFDRPVVGIRDPTVPRRWEFGGAGMAGSIGDYAHFLQMLLNGGTLDGRR